MSKRSVAKHRATGHRAEKPERPHFLVGSFALIVAMVAALFLWAGSGAGNTVDRAIDNAGADLAAPLADDTPATDQSTVRQLGNLQAGRTVKRLKPKCSRAPVSAQITVLSYNIKTARASSLGTLAGVIRSSGADVVLLQEVDRNRRVSGGVNQAAALANSLGGWSHAFGENVTYGPSAGYGTAIISRWPIVSHTNWHLPNAGGGQRRGLLKAVVDIKGALVSFYNTHLQPDMGALRSRQASSVAGHSAGDPNPSILGGDMNSWPRSTWIRTLQTQFTDTWDIVGRGKGATYPARGPRTRIDYLMHRGSALSPLSADVLGSLASDHRAVRASYQLDGVTEKQCTTPGVTPSEDESSDEPSPED